MINKLLNKVILIFAITVFLIPAVHAQQPEAHHDKAKKYRLAYELFVKEKYSASREMFHEFLNEPGTAVNDRINAEYYMALGGAELYHPDAENELVRFTQKYPESLKARTAYFHAGKILYKQKKYKMAVNYFEKTDISYLTNDEVSEYYFKSGYSYFTTGDLTKASKSFHEILNVESKYKTAANYYYAHVAYQNNNLATALTAFEKLKDSESFGPVVPYYIIQIYYEQQNYDELIRYAKTLEGRTDLKNYAEIKRYVAESYYKKGQYEKALEMFEEFEKNYPRLSRDDQYQLGYCNYKLGKYEKAIGYFEKVVNVKDKLQQVAYYNLGDCFLKTKNKQSARNAFQFASKADYDKTIQEESLFNYAKLSLELSFQSVAVNALNDFTRLYPTSKYTDEVNELMAQLYITTKNYKDALVALDKIKAKSEKAKAAYQKVAYFRAIEFFNDRDYEKSIALFNKAITTEVDQKIRAQAMYWKAEAIYHQKQYEAAIKQYRIFIFNPSSINTPMYNTANYNMGYCYFNLENYPEANTWFRKYLKTKAETDPAKYNDALIRIGDGFFVLKDYDNALSYYNDAVAAGAKASDYCLFQNGIIMGIKGDMKGKANTMNQLAVKYPKSVFIDDAQYEKGNALLSQEDYKAAEDIFKKIIRDQPQSEYAKKSLLKIALIQFNLKQDDQALSTYKDVVKKYPSTSEAMEALTGIKNIYVGNGNPQGYFDYIKTVSTVNVSTGAQDSITYEAAEQLYLKGDHKNASRNFEEYLKKFPNGYFELNATFYKAESDYRNKEYAKALAGYVHVTSKPRNLFTEKSLLKSGTIYLNDNKYDEAITDFNRLEEVADFRDNIIEAQSGKMRAYFKKGDFDNTITNARKLLSGDKVSNELINEAHLLHGRASLALNDLQAATTEFTAISKINSANGAEAKYSLALIQYKLGNFKESQKKCFDVINLSPSYEFWIGKSFLLLGDNYVGLKDLFQAKHTYRSVLENYEKNVTDPEDIRLQAKEKLDAIEKGENEKLQKEIEEKEKQYFGSDRDSTDSE
ncbi:MAG: tetratricopeptide repeat protein [Bacteroidetes bacterium]|nr:tetratricopeptide repeat protein [Bacteroidota bacterium]